LLYAFHDGRAAKVNLRSSISAEGTKNPVGFRLSGIIFDDPFDSPPISSNRIMVSADNIPSKQMLGFQKEIPAAAFEGGFASYDAKPRMGGRGGNRPSRPERFLRHLRRS